MLLFVLLVSIDQVVLYYLDFFPNSNFVFVVSYFWNALVYISVFPICSEL